METDLVIRRIDAATIELLDAWRGAQPDVPPRSEAVRRIVQSALERQPQRTLSQLMVAWFSTEPSRMVNFGGNEADSAEHVVKLVLANQPTAVATTSRNLIEILKREEDDIAKEIVSLLKQIAE